MTTFDSMLRFAAVDIGSNAIRLLLAGVRENGDQTTFHKVSLIRMPVRLGYEAFINGNLSDAIQHKLIHTITGFHYLMAAYQPLNSMACATAAMRTAENGPRICARIADRTGVDIEIIDGKREAQILLQNCRSRASAGIEDVLLVDVGGGSTEISLLSKSRIVKSESFPIGTLRLLQGLVEPHDWGRMKEWLDGHAHLLDSSIAIGSGGNINKILRLSQLS